MSWYWLSFADASRLMMTGLLRRKTPRLPTSLLAVFLGGPVASAPVETDFEVSYDGPALIDGRMEVKDLAPALLALAELFREANAIAYPDLPPVALNIQATGRGSFDIYLILSLLAHGGTTAVSMLASDPVTAVANLKEIVIGEEGLFSLLKRLRGRAFRREPQDDGTVIFRTEDGDAFRVPNGTDALHQRMTIRHRVSEVVEPLNSEGIDTVRFRRDTESEAVLEIHRDEVSAFSPRDTAGRTPIHQSDLAMTLEIISPTFVEGRKWRLSDGTRSFTAAIEDESFLARIDRREVRFGKGDRLSCDLHIDQYQTAEGRLSTDFTVTNVRDLVTPTPPTELPLGDVGEIRTSSQGERPPPHEDE